MMIFDLHFTTIYNALLFLIQSKQSCASNEYTIANLERDIKEIIDEAEAFDKSIDDLEYTVIDLENSFAHLQNVGKDPFGFFSANKPDDLITVIEVKSNLRNIGDHMPGISKCLQAYILEDNKKEHFTEDIAMRVDTIKSKDLCRYELLYGSTRLSKQFREFIQTMFIYHINTEIEHGLYRCMTDYLRNKASEYVAEKSFRPIAVDDYRLLKLKAIEDNNIECFFNDAFAHINSVILGDSQECMINTIASKIQEHQLRDKIQYFDSNNLIEEVRKIYCNDFQDLMRCNFTIAKEKMLEAFKSMSVARFKIICGDYFLAAIEKQKSNRSSSVNDSLLASSKPTSSKEVLNHLDSEQGYDMKIKDYFEDALVEFRTKDDAHTLFGLKSAVYRKNLKIVCSEKITKENIHLLCHILNNIEVKAFRKAKQVLYINLREHFDLIALSSQILKLVECYVSETATYGSMHVNHKLNYINISSKKQGERSLSLATIDKSLLLESLRLIDPEDESALTSKICDILERDMRVIDLMRNKRLLLTRDLLIGNKNGITIQYENLNQYDNHDVVKIRIKDVETTDSLKLELFRTVKHINAANNPQTTSNLQDDCRLIHFRTLNKKYIYPRLLQFLSLIVCLPDELKETPYFEIFDFGLEPKCDYLLYDKIVCQNVPTDQVFDQITATKENIEKMHESNLDTFKIHMIETNLSDFLRREHSLSWAKATKEFMKNKSMELATFGKMIYKHLVGMYRKDASKDYVIPSIVSQDHKIVIIAVVRKNTNTILYIVRKELRPVLGNLPMSSLMDFFMDDSNDIYNCDDDSFEDLFIINCVEVNAIVSAVTTMAALKFNMTGDFVTQFERRKDMFVTHLYSLIGRHFSFYDLPFDKAFSSGGNQNTKKVTLMRLTYKSIFEREIPIILARMEQKMKKINLDPAIRVTIISTNAPNTNDLKDVDDTIKVLRQDK